MLRKLFAKPERVDQGFILAANKAIIMYCGELRAFCVTDSDICQRYYHLELWSHGFTDALNELEQSKYCSERYGGKIAKLFEEEMDKTERNDYRLYNYFYKNAFVRVFSILDKLGYFVNEMLELKTERVKSKFSYFTMLRRLHEKKTHTELDKVLQDIKVRFQLPLDKLRKKRNLEIHFMNVEMIDDLLRTRYSFAERLRIENLEENLNDLEQCYEMVCLSLQAVFTYSTRMIGSRG